MYYDHAHISAVGALPFGFAFSHKSEEILWGLQLQYDCRSERRGENVFHMRSEAARCRQRGVSLVSPGAPQVLRMRGERQELPVQAVHRLLRGAHRSGVGYSRRSGRKTATQIRRWAMTFSYSIIYGVCIHSYVYYRKCAALCI